MLGLRDVKVKMERKHLQERAHKFTLPSERRWFWHLRACRCFSRIRAPRPIGGKTDTTQVQRNSSQPKAKAYFVSSKALAALEQRVKCTLYLYLVVSNTE